MMRGIFWLAVVALGLAIPALAERPEDHGTGTDSTTTASEQQPSPPRRPEADAPRPPLDPAALRKQVLDGLNAGTPAWWKAAQDFLGVASKDEAEKLAKEMPQGNRQDLFQELIKARGEKDMTKLREVSQAQTASAARDAARQEIARRIADPSAKFISKWFGRRPELAAIAADKIVNGDDAAAGEAAAKLLGRLKTVQRLALKKRLEALAAEAPGPGKPDAKLIQRLLEAAKVATGDTAETPFAKAFETAYKSELEKNQKFYEKVAQAVGDGPGAAAAKAELQKGADPETVLDAIGSELAAGNDGMAVELAKAFARTDATGNAFLDLAASNAAFKDADRNQVLVLGKEREEFRAALDAFVAGGVDDHRETDGDAGTSNRFQRFRLNPSEVPVANSVRSFAADEGGKPVLKRTTASGRPTETLAKAPVKVASVLPKVTEPPTTPPGKFDPVAMTTFINTKCIGCHKLTITGSTPADFKIQKGSKLPKTLAQVMKAIDDEAGGMVVPKDEKEAFRKLLPSPEEIRAYLTQTF